MHCSLHQSDITDERVDAIVHAANKWLRHGDGVAAAIMRKGGHQIEEEFRRIMSDRKGRPLNVGDVVYTSGGNLSCRFVIHTVGPKWNIRQNKKSISLLHRVCMESLRLATQLELCSMAFPAIGSGNVGLPKDICAQVMFDAVKEFSSSTDAELGTLRDVRIVIIDDETISVFREEFVKCYTSQETSPATNVKSRGLSRKQKAATSHCVNLGKRCGKLLKPSHCILQFLNFDWLDSDSLTGEITDETIATDRMTDFVAWLADLYLLTYRIV